MATGVRTAEAGVRPVAGGGKLVLFLLALVIVIIAEAIGNVTIPLGTGKIVLLPLLWALLIGGAFGLLSPRLPAPLRLSIGLQNTASAYLQPALLIFIAKLGLLVGGSLPKILASGWALVFQEFGHFFGTMVFGLPVALLLGIKREAIGATFSVGREPSLAIIGERYGMDSPEGRGVLAEYLTGTVFGAVFIALLAGFMTSLGIFNPLALAMGAGVGSGSMMAAASGAIAAQQTPEVAKEVATFAAASNLVTTTIGTYFTLFLSLPFTIWAYGKLEPILGRNRPDAAQAAGPAPVAVPHEEVRIGLPETVLAWILIGIYGLIGNWLTYGVYPDRMVISGMAIIIGVVLAGYAIYLLLGRKLPAVLWVSIIGMALTYPGMPFAADVAAMTGKINFLALATPILTFAGCRSPRTSPPSAAWAGASWWSRSWPMRGRSSGRR